jgi:hypothetical protein
MSQSQCGVLDGEIFALDQNGLLALNRSFASPAGDWVIVYHALDAP